MSANRQPLFESLEDRRLMSGTAPAANDVAPIPASTPAPLAVVAATPARASSWSASPQLLGGLVTLPGVFQLVQSQLTCDNASGAAQFVVTRLLGTDGPVSVDYTTGNSTALANTDFVPTAGTLTFADGETSKVISVPLVNNPAAPASRVFNLTLSNPTHGASLGLLSSAAAAITNARSVVSVAGAGVQQVLSNLLPTATVTLGRVGNTALPAVVHFATTAGTALPGVDFTPVSGTVTFLPGQASATVVVPLLGNAAAAAGTAFSLGLTAAGDAGTVLGQAATATVGLTNAQSVISTAVGAATAVTSAGTALVTVTRAGNLDLPTTVQYATAAVAGTPVAGYTPVSGTLSFAAGVATQVVSVPLVAGTLGQASSAFNLVLSLPGVNTLLSSLSHSTQVTAVDSPSVVQLADPTVATLDGATSVVLTVLRTGNTSAAATVDYATADGTAHAGVHYTATAGTLSFAAGETSKTITVALAGGPSLDTLASFAVNLVGAAGGAVLGSGTSSTVTTQNVRSVVQWSAVAAAVDGQAGSVVLTVTRTGNTAVPASVSYATADGTAVAGDDYAAANGTLSFAPGEATKTVAVALTGGPAADPASTFVVTLTGATGNAIVGAAATTVTVANDLSLVRFSPANVEATEDGGTFTVTVTRTGNLGVGGAVAYATQNGTATGGVDYQPTSGALLFAPGQTTATFTVTLDPDLVTEADETVKLVLSDPTGHVRIGAGEVGTLLIHNAGEPARVADVEVRAATKKQIAAGAPHGIVMTFDQPLAAAPKVSDFTLYVRTKDKPNGGGVAKTVPLATVSYDPATRSVTVTPKKPLKPNQFYQLVGTSQTIKDAAGVALDGSGNGVAGSPLSLYFGSGNKLSYRDADGDAVLLTLKGGGLMNLTRRGNGEGLALSVTGANASTVVTGAVKKAKTGNGATTLASVTGLTAAQNKIPAGPFTFNG